MLSEIIQKTKQRRGLHRVVWTSSQLIPHSTDRGGLGKNLDIIACRATADTMPYTSVTEVEVFCICARITW